jgi:hypothetical protein
MFKGCNEAESHWRLSRRASPEALRAALHCLPMEPPFPAQRALPWALLDSLKGCEVMVHDNSHHVACMRICIYVMQIYGIERIKCI